MFSITSYYVVVAIDSCQDTQSYYESWLLLNLRIGMKSSHFVQNECFEVGWQTTSI